jgi:macrolide transport system ATP-binding/permease protein
MQKILQDIRYSFRVMRKKPGFTIFAVLTLALGIGVNTVVFSIANAILFRPLPVTDPEQLIRLYQQTAEGRSQQRFSYPDYRDLRDRSVSLQGTAAMTLVPMRMEVENQSEQILGEAVSGNYFSVLQTAVVSGRGIVSEDDQPGSRPVAVINDRLMRQHFEEDSIPGKTIRLNGIVHDVIGVMNPDFSGTFAGARIDVWVPLSASQFMMASKRQDDRTKLTVHVIGRLKPGISSDQARAELAAIFSALEKEYPDTNRGKTIVIGPASLLHGNLRKGASIFFSAVMVLMGIVLFIACSNLAGLLVTRAIERRREMAIRISLGADRKRVVMQLFTENVTLALLGGLAGLLLAVWVSGLVTSFWPIPTVPIQFDFAPDANVFLFCFGISLLAGLLLGLAPVLQGNKQDLVSALKQQTNVSLFGRMRLKNVLLILQISLCMLLLVSAGLFVRSWQNAEQLDPGFDPQNMLAMDIDLSEQGMSDTQGLLYFTQLVERVESLPGIISVSMADLAPMDLATGRTPVRIPGHTPPAGQDALLISSNRIGMRYFETAKMQMIQGRDFANLDNADSPAVVIINQTMAQRYWANEDPIGKRIQIGPEFKSAAVIGVARDAKYRSPAEEPTPHIYVSYQQFYEPGMSLLVRAQSNPKSLILPIEKEMTSLRNGVQAFFARTLQEHLAFAYLPSKLGGTLLGFFGLLGLLLACIGIYAAISFQVAQRKREIGIRMAIGAKPASILKLFVQGGLKLSLTGCLIGIAASFLLTRLLSSLLVGVGMHDPATFFFVPMLLITVSLFACALPAYRASKLDPLRSLRYE